MRRTTWATRAWMLILSVIVILGLTAAPGTADSSHAATRSSQRYQAEAYTSVTAIDTSTCGLTTSGAVRCWGDAQQVGDNSEWERAGFRAAPIQVVGLESGIVALQGNGGLMCALTAAGEVWCWGMNYVDVLTQPELPATVMAPVLVTGLGGPASAISTGWDSACAIVQGALKCWGFNRWGSVGDGTTSPRLTPTTILASGVTAVAGNSTSTCAVQAGALKCWGQNAEGQLGIGSRVASLTPTAVPTLSAGVVDVTTNRLTTRFCARTAAGAAYCWGSGGYGAIGNGGTTRRLTPTLVRGLSSGVTDITTGTYHSCALLGGGVKCWGDDTWGQLGNASGGSTLVPRWVNGLASGVAQLSAAHHHTCAVTTAHVAKCWGLGGLGNRARYDRIAQSPRFVAATSPGIDRLTPSTGSSAGGYDLHIQGAGFINVTSVLLGDTPATNIRVLSSNELVVTVPAHAAGVVNVKAFTTLGHSVGTEYDDFTYTSG